MSTDQWFNQGDKVMRVAHATELGLRVDERVFDPTTAKGKVLCVSACFETEYGNAVQFVGQQGCETVCFYARCFRRIDEIKLCAAATSHEGYPTPRGLGSTIIEVRAE